MLGKPRILFLFPNSLIISIKHEHSCKILYLLRINLLFEYTDKERQKAKDQEL